MTENNKKIEKELTLFKESGLINCFESFTLNQRKALNALLYFVKRSIFYNRDKYDFDGINKDSIVNEFFISNDDFKKLISDKTVDITDLIESTRKLMKTPIEPNINLKDKYNIWEKEFIIIQGISTENNGLRFRLSDPFFKILTADTKKTPFTKIDLRVSRTFRSKYSLILYEFILDYLTAKSIPLLLVEELRKRFGLKSDEYKRFFNFKIKCLDVAVKEINLTPEIPFFVSCKLEKAGKCIYAVRFYAEKKVIVETAAAIDIKPAVETNAVESQDSGPAIENAAEIFNSVKDKLPYEYRKKLAEQYNLTL